MRELFLHLRAGLLLNVAALLQELNERARLGNVLEVRRHHRVECLLDQAFDVAESLDDERGFLIVDVNHHRKRQGRLERILGDERDFGQVLIKVVRTDFVLDPLQNEVGRWHWDDLARIRVEWILAGQKRLAPDTALAACDQFAVTIFNTGEVNTLLTGVRNHHADIAHVDDRLLYHFHSCEQAVDVVRAFHQYLQLTTAHTVRFQEAIGILEFVMVLIGFFGVITHHRGNDLTLRQGETVMHGHDADLVIVILDDDRAEAVAFLDNLCHADNDRGFVTVDR